MLRDVVVKYYYPPNGYNYNCAESMLRAVSEYYHLDLPEVMLRGVSGFGGGAGHDVLCGALESAVITLSMLYSVNGRGHESDLLTELTDTLLSKFEEKMGYLGCVGLKSRYHVPIRKCESILVTAADLLEEIIDSNRELIVNRK